VVRDGLQVLSAFLWIPIDGKIFASGLNDQLREKKLRERYQTILAVELSQNRGALDAKTFEEACYAIEKGNKYSDLARTNMLTLDVSVVRLNLYHI
jgi:hypothetical protein